MPSLRSAFRLSASLVAVVCSACAQTTPPVANAPVYNPAIFRKTLPSADLTDLTQDAGRPSSDLWHDKHFRKLVNANTPDVMYHYGNDKPLQQCLDIAFSDSSVPVQVRDSRYVMVGGYTSMYGFHGRAFLWFDTQIGILLGGFYFNPSNGEPSPTLTVFSRQTDAPTIALSDLPPEFARDLADWTIAATIPVITTRYFIDEKKKRTLLVHDEDFCLAPDGSHAPAGDPCEEMNENAADVDLTAAEYLYSVHYATNATAWMASGNDRASWLKVVNTQCGVAIACRIRITRRRTLAILGSDRF